jgi:hypothetical protein
MDMGYIRGNRNGSLNWRGHHCPRYIQWENKRLMESVTILKGSVTDLRLCFDKETKAGYFIVETDIQELFAGSNINNALEMYFEEVEKQRARAMKALENRSSPEHQNVIGRKVRSRSR